MKKIFILSALLMCILISTVTAAAKEDITTIAIGTARDEIHSIMGEPQKASSHGYKEIYFLSNGNAAVLTYCGDNLNSGFIVLNYK